MVLREKRINNNSDNVQLHLSFGLPDVKAFLKELASHSEALREYQFSEADVRYFLERCPNAFVSYPDKWKKQLSAWVFCVAVRNGLLEPCATKDRYYLADSLFVKRGRPRLED